MRTVKNLLNMLIIITMLAVGTAGCGSDDQNDNADDAQSEDLPEPLLLLEESVEKLQEAESIEIEMDVEGYPVEVEVENLELPENMPILFKYARGIFQSPDRMQANIQFSLGDFSTTADLIALSSDHYFRGDLLTANRWINAELIPGFSPAALMSAEIGIPFALASITGLQMLDRTRLRGNDVFHLAGMIDADDVHTLTLGLIRSSSGQLGIEVYISAFDYRVAKITLVDPPPADVDEAEATTWEINILNYDQAVTITAPETGSDD